MEVSMDQVIQPLEKKPVLLNAFIFREEMMRTSTMKEKLRKTHKF